MVSINTNLGAYSAQQNLNTASTNTVASTTRLSSGNRIDRDATDVASLSVGTILTTNVSTLKQGLQNAGQAASLLQVADGGLKNISDILQRQKALAVQATSGTLSDVERGYLDQEFQSLTDEINRTVQNTKFSSVTLLDGSLTKQTAVTTDTTDNYAKTGVAAVAVTSTLAVLSVGGTPATGGVVSVNGVPITFAAATDTVDSATAAGKVIVGASTTETAKNIARFLNNSSDARLANFYFTNAANAVSSTWGGGKLNAAATVGIALTGTGITNVTGNSTAIAYSANAVDGAGLGRTFAVGHIGNAGSWLANGQNGAAGAGEAIKLNTVDRTASFTGKIGGDNIGQFTATYVGPNSVIFSLKVDDITYTTGTTTTNGNAALAITFTGKDKNNIATGGTFTLNTTGNLVTGAITSQNDADTLSAQINEAFSDVTFVQNRDISSFNAGATAVANGVAVGNFTGLSTNLRSDDFSNVQISDFKITAPGVGQTDAQISAYINGEQYVSYAGISSKIATNTVIALRNVTDPNKAFSIVTGSTDVTGLGQSAQAGTALDLSSQDNADAVAQAFETAFGEQNGHASLNFQIGSTSADSIGVQVRSASSRSIYGGASLNVKTAVGANAATDVLDKAIQYVASLRADVGALQSRFTYASVNLGTGIQNLDAARGTFLDTDVSTESTLYAQAQVKLQASIAVLAQANQLPQNLLKLLG